MKYLIRSLKYLLYFVIIFCLCLAIVVLFSHQSFSDIPSLFKEGSFLPICLIFLGFALLYPAVGYRKAKLVLDGEWKDYMPAETLIIFKTVPEAREFIHKHKEYAPGDRLRIKTRETV